MFCIIEERCLGDSTSSSPLMSALMGDKISSSIGRAFGFSS